MRLRELTVTYRPVAGAPAGPRPRLASPADSARLIAPLIDAEAVEVFGLLLLNTKHEPLAWHVLSRGTLDATLVHPQLPDHRGGGPVLQPPRIGPVLGRRAMRAAVYVRVSTLDQHPQNQIDELRRYVAARGWQARESVDHGISGAKENRPALDALMRAARRRTVDVVVVWSLDRLGRSLKHLISLLDELQALELPLISLREGLDLSTPAGRLQWQIIGAISEFERARIAERIRAGLARARTEGRRLGRPPAAVPIERLATVTGLTDREAARRLKVSRATLQRWRALARKTLADPA
jgi:DNA invertase Pin-like site-specific DNA recombinase